MDSTLIVTYLEQAGLVLILMVVYLEEGGQSGSPRGYTWREKDGFYPDGGLPGASRLVLILMVVYLGQAGWY
jgi:hypothetical protein